MFYAEKNKKFMQDVFSINLREICFNKLPLASASGNLFAQTKKDGRNRPFQLSPNRYITRP